MNLKTFVVIFIPIIPSIFLIFYGANVNFLVPILFLIFKIIKEVKEHDDLFLLNYFSRKGWEKLLNPWIGIFLIMFIEAFAVLHRHVFRD